MGAQINSQIKEKGRKKGGRNPDSRRYIWLLGYVTVQNKSVSRIPFNANVGWPMDG